MIEKIKQTAELLKELSEVGVYRVGNNYGGPMEAQMGHESLVEVNGGVEGLQIKNRGGNEYPYEISFTNDGIKFYAVVKQEEFDKTFGEEMNKEVISALEKQLSILKGEVALT